ncbi:uncharacterized protein METZ01_LOCUS77322 [marine metagenome]|uniref:Uncharacterized protein n=1 Tax=marine metagenome TaxID=408172 RepID=A0A381UA76_9ZZZZ
MAVQGRPDGTESGHQRWDEIAVAPLVEVDQREGLQTADLLRVVRLRDYPLSLLLHGRLNLGAVGILKSVSDRRGVVLALCHGWLEVASDFRVT